jgi:hypothetical protein
MSAAFPVIPAKAGIHSALTVGMDSEWTPAFAGVTEQA